MKKRSNLAWLLSFAKGYRYLTIAAWFLSAVSALILLIPLVYIWCIIREVLQGASKALQTGNLIHYGLMAVIFSVAGELIYVVALMCSHLGAFRIARNLRIHIINHIITLPVGVLEGFGSGKLRKVTDEATAATETYLAHQLTDKAGAIATPIGLILLLVAFDWRLGLLSLIPVLLGFLIMLPMTGSSLKDSMKSYQDSLDAMSNEAVEYVRGIPVIKTFGQTIHSFKRFKAAIETYEGWVKAYSGRLMLPMTFYTTAINAVFAVLIAAALWLTRQGTAPNFFLNLMFYIVITPIITVTMSRIMFQSENELIVNDAIMRIDSVLNLKPLKAAPSPVIPGDASVKLNNVSYSYNGKTNALNGVSLSIKPGETVALVGPSGGGKTTVANLLTRFLDADGGEILIGGVNVQDIGKEDLMQFVSFVFQNSRLIKDSILNNVRLGKPSASREEVLAAIKEAQCMDIIEKFPQGIDTVIGTKGIYLSGGEQQRISIARALLKDSPILLLDEATAYADPDNEYRMQQAFSRLAKGKTVIMIAHRLSTVVNADRIFVLKGGAVAESGKHEELIEQQGIYASMWKDYQTSISWRVGKEGGAA